jgi:hypothetical protein
VYGYYFIHSSFLPPVRLLIPIPWALALLSNNALMYQFALAAQVLHLLFYILIDKPHRTKVLALSVSSSVAQPTHHIPIDTPLETAHKDIPCDKGFSDDEIAEQDPRLVGRLKNAAKELVANAKPRVSEIVRKTKSKVARLGRP